jgi:hypothetical protein
MAALLGAAGAVAGIAGSAFSAAGTLAAGRAESRVALERARAESAQAMALAEAEAAQAGNVAATESSSILASSAAQGLKELMTAVAQTQGLLTNIPLLQMRADTERMAGEVEATSLRMQAKEELAQGSSNMLQSRRAKNLLLSKLTTTASASGFTATDATALRISDDITRHGAVQEGMELYGAQSRADGLRASAAARSYAAASQGLASLMEADAMRQAGQYTLEAGQFASDLAIKTGKMLSTNALTTGELLASNARRTGGLSSNYALRIGGAASKAATAGSWLTAGGTILSGASTMAAKYG